MPVAGDVIGPYVLVRALGRGGMGETWVGVRRSSHVEQRVCVKLVSPELRASPEVVRMFRQEAALAASVRHGNLVQVVDVGEDGGYIAYELVDGTDLRTVLREAPGHRLASELVVYVLIEVCKALDYLHTRTYRGELSPIIHRDVSPSNILISHRGEVKLADLGIAKALREAERSEHVKGKVSYLSPEQANLDPVDARTDLYALGVTAYEALSAKRPFEGESAEQILSQVIQGKAVPLRQAARHASVGLVEVIETMMARDPENRYATAMDVIRALAENAPPPVLAFEALGRQALVAQPHQTVYEDLSESIRAEATRTAPPVAPTVTAAQRDAQPAASPGERPARGGRTEPAARPQRSNPQASPLGSLRLGLAVAAGSAVVLGAAFLVWQLASAEPASVIEPAAESAEGRASPEPTAGADSENDEPSSAASGTPSSASAPPTQPPAGPAEAASQAAGPADPAPAAPSAERPGSGSDPSTSNAPPSRPETTQPSSARPQKPRPRPRRTGVLKVGAFPSGKVWVDGRLRGSAPLTVRLPVGRHRVAVGRDEPTETRSVRIRRDATEQLVFNLRAPSGSEAP